jgi:hypothetical protein
MPLANGKLWLGIAGLVVAVTMGGLSGLLAAQARMAEVDKRVALIEGDRFTTEDGAHLWRAMNDVRGQMIQDRYDAPPEWFVIRVDKLENKLDRIDLRLQRVEKTK